HTSGDGFTLALANLPLAGGGSTNLLSDMSNNGFLDFALQDDTSIDYITLDVTSCCCAPDQVVECGTDWGFVAPVAHDACCGDDVTIRLLSTVTNGFCPQIITQTWEATDCCGNSATCLSRVIVVDTTPPVITCAPAKTIECGTRVTFDQPTAYDSCCGNEVSIRFLYSYAVDVGQGVCTQQYVGVWQAVDCCGNSNTCSQTITVVDTKPPVFTTYCVTNRYQVGVPYGTPAAPSADLQARVGPNTKDFDDCTVNRWVAHTFPNLPPCITSAKLTVALKPCGDICENDAIGVWFTTTSGASTSDWTSRIGTDGSTPGLFSDNWCNHTAGEVVMLDLSNMPGTGANLLPALNGYGFMDFVCEDDTAVDYLILDVVSCCCATNKTVECGSQWDFDTPSAIDDCCGTNITISVLNTVTNLGGGGTTQGPCSYQVTRTWVAVDCCGNSTTCGQTVTVADRTPPQVQCAPGKGVICGTDWSFDSPQAYDACCPTRPTITVQSTVTNGHGCDLLITRTWLITDCCGNSTNCSQTVQVGDPDPPIVTCPRDKTVACGADWVFDRPSAYDLCCGNNVDIQPISMVTNRAGCPPDSITRIWEIGDCCGNFVTCTQTVFFKSCVPGPAGVALWLPLDDNPAQLCANLAAGAPAGRPQNNPPSVNGYVNKSFCFDGSTQFVAVQNYAAINPGTGDLSIDAWVKRDPNSGNGVRVIVDKREVIGPGSNFVGYSLSVSFGQLVFQLAGGAGFTNYRDTNGVVPADGQWHFVAVTVDRTSTTGGQFYVDGAPTTIFDPTGQPGSLDNNASFYAGAGSPGISGNSPWLGCLDEIEFFARQLSAAEVQSIYDAGTAGKCKPLLVCSPDNGIFMLWHEREPCGGKHYHQPLAAQRRLYPSDHPHLARDGLLRSHRRVQPEHLCLRQSAHPHLRRQQDSPMRLGLELRSAHCLLHLLMQQPGGHCPEHPD
ncbi:MAG: hypothetical protein DME25_13930, partial [Verrucomicrobia bacterium]